MIKHSALASAQLKVSIASNQGLIKRLHVVLPTHRTQICFGVKLRRHVWKKRKNLLTPSTRNIQISCLLTTVRHHLTGRRTWMTQRSRSSRLNFQQWVTNQFTLAGIHNSGTTVELSHNYARGEGMKHCVEMVQEPEFDAVERGYTFVAHQQEVGTGYFDDVTTVIQGGQSSDCTTGSTEEQQF